MSFRNRCQIAGAEGVINLSVPLVDGRDQKRIIKDVKISDRDNWQAQHWKTILSCYSRSPWFEYYRDSLEGVYQKRVVFLLDWNLWCWEWTLDSLKWPLNFSLTDAYQQQYDPVQWVDLRGKWMPKDRYTGWGLEEAGVVAPAVKLDVPGAVRQVARQEARPVAYRQVFEERTGFIPNLSILDLLFCEGKRTREVLGC